LLETILIILKSDLTQLPLRSCGLARSLSERPQRSPSALLNRRFEQPAGMQAISCRQFIPS
jgi:hypothetical protein